MVSVCSAQHTPAMLSGQIIDESSGQPLPNCNILGTYNQAPNCPKIRVSPIFLSEFEGQLSGVVIILENGYGFEA